jgi:hypothetical protein
VCLFSLSGWAASGGGDCTAWLSAEILTENSKCKRHLSVRVKPLAKSLLLPYNHRKINQLINAVRAVSVWPATCLTSSSQFERPVHIGKEQDCSSEQISSGVVFPGVAQRIRGSFVLSLAFHQIAFMLFSEVFYAEKVPCNPIPGCASSGPAFSLLRVIPRSARRETYSFGARVVLLPSDAERRCAAAVPATFD